MVIYSNTLDRGAVKRDIDYSQIGIKDLTMAGPLLTMAWAMFGSS